MVWRRLAEVAKGLCYLHSKGILHGDLRCDSIVVSANGTAMLTDFGQSFRQDASSITLVTKKESLATLQFRAPECVKDLLRRNGEPVRPSHAADAYSLGMCIYEAVVGGIWQDWLDTDTIRQRIMQWDGTMPLVQKPTKLTEEQWWLVDLMIKYSPDERPPMSLVLRQLEQFARDEANPNKE